MQLKNQIFSVLLLLGLSGCIDLADLSDAQVPDYEAEFALPLINSRVTIKDILDNDGSIDQLMVDLDGTLRFQYQGTEIRREGAEVFEQLTGDFPPVFPVLLPETRFPLSLISDIELDRLDFKGGQLVYYFENSNPENLSVEFEFSSLQQGGAPLRVTAEVPAFSGVGLLPAVTNRDGPIDLSTYQLLPDDNEIVLRYAAKNAGGQDRLLANFVIQIQNPSFSYAEGYLGQFVIEGVEDAVGIDFVERYAASNIQFADPRAMLFVEHSFGVPIQAQINEFIVQNANGTEQEVESTQIDQGLSFSYPGLDEVGTMVSEIFTFDKNNSNILALFAGNPVSMIYDVDALVNPEANPDLVGFITDSSYYTLQLMVDLPLFGSADDYVLRDTLEFNLREEDEIERASFKIIAENELGVDATVQVHFLDAQGSLIETLFIDRQLIAQAALVDDTGLATSPAVTTTFVETDAVRSERIRQASQMALEIGFSTETNRPNPVRILEQQGLRVKMGAIVTVRSN